MESTAALAGAYACSGIERRRIPGDDRRGAFVEARDDRVAAADLGDVLVGQLDLVGAAIVVGAMGCGACSRAKRCICTSSLCTLVDRRRICHHAMPSTPAPIAALIPFADEGRYGVARYRSLLGDHA